MALNAISFLVMITSFKYRSGFGLAFGKMISQRSECAIHDTMRGLPRILSLFRNEHEC